MPSFRASPVFQVAALAESANLGLGWGNPNAIAAVREGETVPDLSSGVGIDCRVQRGRLKLRALFEACRAR